MKIDKENRQKKKQHNEAMGVVSTAPKKKRVSPQEEAAKLKKKVFKK